MGRGGFLARLGWWLCRWRLPLSELSLGESLCFHDTCLKSFHKSHQENPTSPKPAVAERHNLHRGPSDSRRHLAQSLPLGVIFLTCKVQAGPEGLEEGSF